MHAGGDSTPFFTFFAVDCHNFHPLAEIQGKSLGMKVEVFDPSGNNIEHIGEPGEMVCTRPHVSLPISFWGDESGEKFKKAYFDYFPGQSQVSWS